MKELMKCPICKGDVKILFPSSVFAILKCCELIATGGPESIKMNWTNQVIAYRQMKVLEEIEALMGDQINVNARVM